MLVSAFGIGIFTAPPLATFIMHIFSGYRYAFLFLALLSVLLMLSSFVFLKDYQSQVSRETIKYEFKILSSLISFVPSILSLAFMEFSFLALYATYLTLAYGFDSSVAALAISPYGLGVIAGGLLGARLSTKIHGVWVKIFAILTPTTVLILNFNTIPNFLMASLTSLCIGTMLSGLMFQFLLFETQRSLPRHFLATSTAFFYMIHSLSSIPPGYILGSLAEHIGWRQAGTIFYGSMFIIALSGIFLERTKKRKLIKLI